MLYSTLHCPRVFSPKTLLISCNICEKLNHCHTAFASGDRNQAKMGSVFAPPPLTENLHTDPKRVPPCGPEMGTVVGPPSFIFSKTKTGLGVHRLRRQDFLGRQTDQAQVPAYSKALSPLIEEVNAAIWVFASWMLVVRSHPFVLQWHSNLA